jgi:hypothetical protein
MTDQELQAEQEVSTEDTAESPSAESEVTEEAQPQEAEESERGDEESAPQKSGSRDIRSERRIKSLIDKLKEKDQQLQQLQGANPLADNEPLITPEDYENGLDPKDLEERLARRQAGQAQSTKAQIKAELAYEQQMREHQNDIEVVSKDPELANNPVLDKIVAQQYQLMNYRIDPYSGQEYFVPTMKLSEIKNMVKQDLDSYVSKQVASSNNNLAEASESSALRPSESANADKSMQDLTLEEIEAQVGTVRYY